jgi:pimeloyl-ACP methyl ester carboxylesterase
VLIYCCCCCHHVQTETNKLYVVGHSLGGAMAAVAALHLSYLLRSTQTGADVGGVWLFGCPRIGNEAWSIEYNRRLLDRTLRIANYGDFASRLPMKLQLCPSAAKILSNFEFRHVGRSVLLCPDSATGLTDWRLSTNGSEVLDCGPRPDPHDLTLSTHWLGPTMDAWRRAVAAAAASVLSVDAAAADPHMASVMCSECSLSFPHDRAKQLNVPVRAGGPVGCCTSASCSVQSAWDAAATLTGGLITRSFNPLSVCSGYLCT